MFKNSSLAIFFFLFLAGCSNRKLCLEEDKDNSFILQDSIVLYQPQAGLQDGDCGQVMTMITFNKAYLFLEQKNKDEQYDLCNQLISNNCLSTYQIKNLLELDFTNLQQYELAKLAIPQTSDLVNYEQVIRLLKYEFHQKEIREIVQQFIEER